MSDKEKDRDGEKEQLKQQLNQEMGVLEERAKILKDGKDKSVVSHTYCLS